MDVVGCGVYLKEFCEEDLLTKDNLKTSLCFVFYLSFQETQMYCPYSRKITIRNKISCHFFDAVEIFLGPNISPPSSCG